MFGWVRRAAISLLVFLIGWAIGAVFGVPERIRTGAEDLFGADILSPQSLEAAGARGRDAFFELEQVTEDFFATFGEDVDEAYGDETGSSVNLEWVTNRIDVSAVSSPADPIEPSDDRAPRPETRTPQPEVVTNAGDALRICATSVSNAPPADGDGIVIDFRPTVTIDGVQLLIAPATRSCLSSGFGPRGASSRLHKGVDYYTKENGDVLSAADGTIVEAVYRDDYGYMIVIDHGGGIYTRSAHLKRFAPSIARGARVSQGQVLGPIGSSGAYTSAAHLHLEFLRGDISNPKGSFGLEPVNPFSF
ncbi:MAG: M23 family metallopeptidase [Pseudomonadota bacterium]